MSAIGVEPLEEYDEKAKRLISAVNRPCVKEISIRDDIETFYRQYFRNPCIRVSETIDPATWSCLTYKDLPAGIRSENCPPVIGLGITREKLFEDYGHPEMTGEIQLAFWKQVTEELEKRGLSWKLFTNGLPQDEDFAREVLDYIGHGEKAPVPVASRDLIRLIAGFTGLIAGRMHANIIAASLGIPCIGFLWNQKLLFWGRKTGQEERILPIEQMSPENAVAALETAMKEKRIRITGRQKRSVYQPMKRFVRKWCRPKEKETEDLPLKEILTAPSLGCIDKRWRYTNSPEAFRTALSEGFQNFETDLCLTAEGKLVCAHLWRRNTFRMLRLPCDPSHTWQQAPEGKDFFESKSYYRFSTMSFMDFGKVLSEAEGYKKIILGLGRPSLDKLQGILEQISSCLDEYHLDRERFLLCLKRRKDMEYCLEHSIGTGLMFYQPDPGQKKEKNLQIYRDNLEFCTEKGIGYMQISPKQYTEAAAELIRQYPVKIFCSSPKNVQEIVKTISYGASLVASPNYSVAYLEKLFSETSCCSR